MAVKETSQARAAATRARIVRVARKLFIEHGYDGVSTGDVLRAAGVSRGALYHHFEGKRDLFRAVYEVSEAEALEHIASRATEAATPFDALLSGAGAYMDECVDSASLRRIGLIDSRRVLGWERWREAAADYGLGIMRATLEQCMQAGQIERQDVDVLAHVVVAALAEAATMIAFAADPAAMRRRVQPAVTTVIEGLRARR